MNLVSGETYTQKDIDNLIANATQSKDAGQEQAPAEVSVKLANGVMTASKAGATTATTAGLRATGSDATNILTLVGDGTNGAHGSSDKITFTANTYGKAVDTNMASKITISTTVAAGRKMLRLLQLQQQQRVLS